MPPTRHQRDTKSIQIPSEITPKNSTGSGRIPLPPSPAQNVLSTPKKRAHWKKHSAQERSHQQVGTPEKKACVSLEMSCVRKQPMVALARLEIEPENEEEGESTEESDNEQHSDQESRANHSAAPGREPLSFSLPHNVLSPSNKIFTKRGHRKKQQQEGTPEKKACESLYMSCVRKQPIVQLSPLKIEPEDEEEKQSTDESDNEQHADQEQTGLSAYELERLKNIKQNAKFLNSLKLLEAASSLCPHKNQKRVIKREKPQNTEDSVVRRSMRLQRIEPSGAILPEEHAPAPAKISPPGPIKMIPTNQVQDADLDTFLKKWASTSEEKVTITETLIDEDLQRYEAKLKALTLKTHSVAKIVPNRIFSLAIHPSESQTIVAAGDKWGHVGLYDMNHKTSKDGIYTFALHSKPVSTVSFSPSNSAHLLSLSCDGTIRCGDINCSVFNEIYHDEEESFSSFDFLSADGSVLIVSHWDSQLSVVDRRTPGTTHEWRTSVGLMSARTVCVHPLQRELCVVAGSQDVYIYDVRQLNVRKTQPLLKLLGHTKSVASAYFSPNTGRRILTTCADDCIRVYKHNSTQAYRTIRHNNYTGRWLSRFQAVWDPKQDNCFVVGSREQPRQIEVFYKSEIVHSLCNEYLKSVCSINVIHPNRTMVVGGNSSGYVYIFC